MNFPSEPPLTILPPISRFDPLLPPNEDCLQKFTCYFYFPLPLSFLPTLVRYLRPFFFISIVRLQKSSCRPFPFRTYFIIFPPPSRCDANPHNAFGRWPRGFAIYLLPPPKSNSWILPLTPIFLDTICQSWTGSAEKANSFIIPLLPPITPPPL